VPSLNGEGDLTVWWRQAPLRCCWSATPQTLRTHGIPMRVALWEVASPQDLGPAPRHVKPSAQALDRAWPRARPLRAPRKL